MAYVKKDKRAELKERFLADYKQRVAAAGGNVVPLSRGDEALEIMLDFMLEQPKEATRSKTFRLPVELMDWLESTAAANGRKANGELIELLRNAKAHQA